MSGQEQYAHDLIVEHLSLLHPAEVNTHVGGYGVVAYWKASNATSETITIAFRADIDALPTGHRCGHDGHTAIMLRFAQIVDTTRLRHNVVIIFQPEEETGKGAKKILASGLLQKYGVKVIFGLHNLPGFPLGTVVLNRSTFAAGSCGVIYRFYGRSTHASTPELGVNPGLAIASVIGRMSKLNSKPNTKKLEMFRQTTLICCRIGEEAFGTSAGSGEVMFTLRTFTNGAMNELMRAADAIAVEESQRWNLELEKQLREPFKVTQNTTALVDSLQVALQGVDTLLIETPFRWSEDFAEYLTVFPGAFFGLGSGEMQPELHNPSYNFPDQLIEKGACCFELILKNITL